MMDIIRTEIEAREASEKVSNSNRGNDRSKGKFSTPVGTTKAFVAATDGQKRTVRCFFCSNEHYATDCQEITDVKKSIEILTAARRCLCCLKQGHFARNCCSNRQCNRLHEKQQSRGDATHNDISDRISIEKKDKCSTSNGSDLRIRRGSQQESRS